MNQNINAYSPIKPKFRLQMIDLSNIEKTPSKLDMSTHFISIKELKASQLHKSNQNIIGTNTMYGKISTEFEDKEVEYQNKRNHELYHKILRQDRKNKKLNENKKISKDNELSKPLEKVKSSILISEINKRLSRENRITVEKIFSDRNLYNNKSKETETFAYNLHDNFKLNIPIIKNEEYELKRIPSKRIIQDSNTDDLIIVNTAKNKVIIKASLRIKDNIQKQDEGLSFRKLSRGEKAMKSKENFIKKIKSTSNLNHGLKFNGCIDPFYKNKVHEKIPNLDHSNKFHNDKAQNMRNIHNDKTNHSCFSQSYFIESSFRKGHTVGREEKPENFPNYDSYNDQHYQTSYSDYTKNDIRQMTSSSQSYLVLKEDDNKLTGEPLVTSKLSTQMYTPTNKLKQIIINKGKNETKAFCNTFTPLLLETKYNGSTQKINKPDKSYIKYSFKKRNPQMMNTSASNILYQYSKFIKESKKEDQNKNTTFFHNNSSKKFYCQIIENNSVNKERPTSEFLHDNAKINPNIISIDEKKHTKAKELNEQNHIKIEDHFENKFLESITKNPHYQLPSTLIEYSNNSSINLEKDCMANPLDNFFTKKRSSSLEISNQNLGQSTEKSLKMPNMNSLTPNKKIVDQFTSNDITLRDHEFDLNKSVPFNQKKYNDSISPQSNKGNNFSNVFIKFNKNFDPSLITDKLTSPSNTYYTRKYYLGNILPNNDKIIDSNSFSKRKLRKLFY